MITELAYTPLKAIQENLLLKKVKTYGLYVTRVV